LLLIGLCLPLALSAQTNVNLVLADVDGFNDDEIYPVGNLRAVQDGPAIWQPASSTPGRIVDAGGAHGKVLRRVQTNNVDNVDNLWFPAVSNGVLTIQFDARASTASARTLDVFLYPTSGGETSLLGWGTVTNKFCYYDGANWIPIRDLDTEWHRIEMINYLSGPRFGGWDLKFDGSLIGTNLPWRNQHPPGTAYSRLRIGGIRGPSGVYGEVDNLVVTAEVPFEPPELLVLTNPIAADGAFSFAFQTNTNAEYLVESAPSLPVLEWPPLAIVPGTGGEVRFTNEGRNKAQYYRLKKLPLAGRADGYRGIWFTLGQFSEYGDKYSGGLGTYTANHVPIAIYSPEVNRTFFVYGGTVRDQRYLLNLVSYYDHATGQVPRPTIVHDKKGVNDPHDNSSLCMDGDGHLWVFVSGRGNSRPGYKYRSKQPYSIAEFEQVQQQQFTYPQPWFVPGEGFLHLFTKYTAGRELYWETSTNGVNWSAHQKLAGIGGHYQVSSRHKEKVGTFFNRHPGGNVDRRTDLYYMQTTNMGATWTTVDGVSLTVPLTTTNNPALVIDYASQNKLMYTCDLNFDTNGNPVLLYIVSNGHQPGPGNAPRTWTITRWDGTQWLTSAVCESDHNYDMGSLYIRPDRWLIVGPTQVGPQVWQTGGEMALWSSQDLGQTWTMERQITTNSVYNHTYARRPLNAMDPFFAFWADGNPTNVSPSRLYFSDSDGTTVRQLPYDMSGPIAEPEEISF
jgi:hypothetical protein